MDFFCRNGRVPWRLQPPRTELPKERVDVVCHHGDHRPVPAIKIAEEDLVSPSGENAERAAGFRRGIAVYVLKVEDLRVELEGLSELATPDLRDYGHLGRILAATRFVRFGFHQPHRVRIEKSHIG